MDATFAVFCVGCGGATWASAYVLASGDSRRSSSSPTGADGALRRLMEWVDGLPAVAYLRASSRRRALRSAVLRQLPTMLDVVTLGLSAGLSFDTSLEMYCNRYPTELSQVFGEALLSWRIGIKSREEALVSVARDLDLAALRRFSDAVCQALAFGSPLSAVLEQQAQTIRDEQRAELEAEIERVPVKMLIPLGTLVVPAMLLAILGPIVGSSMRFG